MKQMYMLFFGLLVLILAGCSDHDWVDTNTDKPVKVTAQIAKSRVGFNEVDNITNAYWQEGDAITLFTSSQGNLDYVAGASAGSSSSKAFTPRSSYLKAIDGEQVLACYPASTIEDGKVSLPITTDWEDNDPMPFAYAVSSIEDSEVNLQFEHVFSFLKLTVTPSMLSDTTKAVRQLIVRTSSGAPLSIGEGSTFDYSTKEASIANGENTIQIATDTKVVRTPWEVYLPVLPQPEDADITITLADEAGEILFELTKKTPSTGLEKGNVYRVGTSISYDTSFLIDGPTFNTRIKSLANDADITYTNADSLIRKIEFVTDTELMTFLDDCIEVSSSDSPCPIYASFNSTDSLLTVFTAAKDIEIVDASSMFGGLGSLRIINFNKFEVNEKTIKMSNMFSGCFKLASLDISDWNTSNVKDMSYTFEGCSSLISLDISGWDTSNVTFMGYIFSGCSCLTSLDLSDWDISNMKNLPSIFSGCSGLTNLDVSSWDTSNITNMVGIFSGCSGLDSLDVSDWDTSNVKFMGSAFQDCSSLTSLDISGWDTSNVTLMTSIFSGCSSLTSLDVSDWDTSNLKYMPSIFSGCSSLISLDVSGWDTSNVTQMIYTFSGCSGLTSLNLSGWNTSNVTYMLSVFSGCSGLTILNISNWSFNEGISISSIFSDCASISQACRITTKQETKEFLLSNTDNTGMTPSWFIWGDAASDGSSFDTVPKEDW